MIQVFEHNRIAYESARDMLAQTGKAAIVHPTGTGKSFIGFKLCEENSDKTVCWLSPSEYIFKTQIENLKTAGGEEPANIKFFTYAKLMLMSEAELLNVKPDYIILDEFHRCGAEMWGRGVQSLLKMYPDAPILGLSATAIRYLDNQRDMADELFDGCIASEMTLGDAIVRGILNPPKYVLSVYSYQMDLEKYERRVRRAKSRAVQDAAQKYLEALRRALDKADGIDRIFEKHITDKAGKYILFCANAEHMRQMIPEAKKWFANIDPNPHIYSVYSDDPSASKSFADFKADGDDTHLRLLFCIDALNEGIHVENVSGVILLRPTVSPIIYKQQIGRALSASKSREPVIFDVVMNIENLYSIESVTEEMRVAMTYYRSIGGEIINSQFEVIDELRDCRELFEKLNDTLTASWDMMYECAKAYYAEYGNLNVPRRYKTPDGYSLGSWIFTQRKVRSGEQYGRLDESRIAKLDEIGMIWDSMRDAAWERYYSEAKKYYETHGNLLVNVNDNDVNGVALGRWIANLRSYRKSGIKTGYLTPERIAQLNAIGMVWDVPDYLWERNYLAAMEYHREHGNLDIPINYVDQNGIRLGVWLNNIRQTRSGKHTVYRLTIEQIQKLSELGMVWERRYAASWEKGFAVASKYYSENGNISIPSTYITPDGFKLGDWLSNQREKYRAGKMSEERMNRLNSIGMQWTKEDPWEMRFNLAREFYSKHGHLNVPAGYNVNGVCLSKWVNEQKQAYRGNRKKKLTEDQITRLEEIGIVWQRYGKKPVISADINAGLRG